MNSKKVPQLFVATGATKWNDPKDFPWTMGWQPSYQSEAQIYAKYILKNKPNAKIAVLYQNDDYGKDYLKGLKDGLGAKAASMIVAEESYETTEPTIDNHIVKLKSSGADVFFNITTPKFAAQAIKKDAELGWKPLHYPQQRLGLGRQRAQARRFRERAGHHFGGLPEGRLRPAMEQRSRHEGLPRLPGQGLSRRATSSIGSTSSATASAQTLVQVLKQCGDDLTRENIMKQAANLKDFRVELLLPGIKINTSPTDFAPISQLQLMRFKGEKWDLFGDVISARCRRLSAGPRPRARSSAKPPRRVRGGFLLPANGWITGISCSAFRTAVK